MRASAIVLAMLAMAIPAAAETVQLYAAGSLKAALTDVAKAYEAMTGNKIDAQSASDQAWGTIHAGKGSLAAHWWRR
jgi:ABC-type molybdate transport system substrate-binding protein